jgi:hypothetical protein
MHCPFSPRGQSPNLGLIHTQYLVNEQNAIPANNPPIENSNIFHLGNNRV